MGKGGKGKDTPAPKKHRAKAAESTPSAELALERKQGQYVRCSKAAAGPHRQPPEPPGKSARVDAEATADEGLEQSETTRPAAAETAAAAKAGSEVSRKDDSSDEQDEPVVVVRRYQKQTGESKLPGKTQAPGEKQAPDTEEEKEPASGAKAAKERASGSTQPMQVDEPLGATRPAEEEDISPKAGGPKSSKKSEGEEPIRLKESGERTLATVKEEMQSNDSVYEPVVLKPCEQPRLPEQDLSQAALLLFKGKNNEKEDLRTRIHNGCVYKYYGRPPSDGKPSERVSSHPTHLGTGGTRTVYSCPWDDKLVMKFSPWDQSAEKSWLDKLGNMSVKIQGAGTIQAEIEGRNGTRSKEIWSVTLATRAAPVVKRDSTRAWELAILVSTSSQVAHICDIGRSNVCQNVEHGFLQLIDAGTWISHSANPRFPNKTRASGFWSLLAREQPEVSAIIKAALHRAGPWNYRDFIPALIRAMVERESHVQTLLTRLLGSGALLRDPGRAVCFPLLLSKPDEVPMRWELIPLQVHAEEAA